jgi:heme-degrading monooxygenase HmoA
MVIVLFEHRLREDIDKVEWDQEFGRMFGLASKTPGFISIDGYASEDGGALAVVRFESEDAVLAWKNHPEHMKTQDRGREEFFESYKMTVATSIVREYKFDAPAVAKNGIGQ